MGLPWQRYGESCAVLAVSAQPSRCDTFGVSVAEFWKMWESYVDVIIIVLCIGATVTEHLPGLKTSTTEDSLAMACRLLRDAIRILRVVVLMCWLSKSVVEFQEEESEHDGHSGNEYKRESSEPIDVKREYFIHRIDPLSYDRGLNDSAASSYSSQGGKGWKRGDIVGDVEASSSSANSSFTGGMRGQGGLLWEAPRSLPRSSPRGSGVSPLGRSGSLGRSRCQSFSSLGSVGEEAHDETGQPHVVQVAESTESIGGGTGHALMPGEGVSGGGAVGSLGSSFGRK